jgi:peptidoglycan/xylan/chitin deacetylase (PgdA/CDA1 family)
MRRALLVPATAALVHAAPSVVALGQWTRLRALRGVCRWRGPAVDAIALTFDDGPDPQSTPRVLDRLDDLGLRGTFFCLGHRVVDAPEVVVETVARGHEIAVHGFVHDHHFARTPRWVRADLDAALEVLAHCGVEPRWYRPPYGQVTAGTLLAARRRRVETVLWSGWGREWGALDGAAVAARVRAALEPGAIVLFHDSDVTSPRGTVDRVIDALAPIADELRRRHLDSFTLSELVECEL